MKKIGLATFFYDDNFGTCLQAYALQNIIEKMNYEVSLIRYHRDVMPVGGNNGKLKKIFQMSPRKTLWWLWNRKSIIAKKRKFTEFRDCYLKLSDGEDYYRNSDFHGLAEKYDALVCGSDMLWSNEFKEDWPFYYLSFADSHKTVSYAPSFGKNYLTHEEIISCATLIRNIGNLSCREEAGVKMIKDNFNLDATHVIDPTLLIDSKQWDTVINNQESLVDGKYTLVYLFNGTIKHGRKNVIEQAERMVDSKLVILSGAEGKFKKYEYPEASGPLEFVQLYRNSSFVITDTFHGMLFAIIFNKPFVVLDKSPFGISADRLTSTLETLGISNRYVKNDIILDDSFIRMDYSDVNERLSILRKRSLEYLSNSLQNACK